MTNIKTPLNDKLTYIEPFNYLNKVNFDRTIDIKKVTSRKVHDKNNAEIPHSTAYFPNYDSVSYSKAYSFGRSNTNKDNKKNKLRKLWTSKNVFTGYSLVKFD